MLTGVSDPFWADMSLELCERKQISLAQSIFSSRPFVPHVMPLLMRIDCCIIEFNTILNNSGGRIHPSRTPVLTPIRLLNMRSCSNRVVELPYRALIS